MNHDKHQHPQLQQQQQHPPQLQQQQKQQKQPKLLRKQQKPQKLLKSSDSKKRTRKSRKPIKQSELGLQILFGENWRHWNILSDQLSYVTPNYISKKVAQLGNHYFGQHRTCWDMFGGMGMDALNLAQVFDRVKVTEIDSRIFECLIQNLEEFPLTGPEKVEARCGDCLVALRDPDFIKDVDVIHFDPPWGKSFRTGEDFRFEDVLLSGQSNESDPTIIDLLDSLLDRVSRMILKSPITCQSFERWAAKKDPPVRILQVCEFPTHKLKYLYIDRPAVISTQPARVRTRPRSKSNAETTASLRP